MTALSTSHAISLLTLDRQKLITSSTESNGFSATADAFKRIGELVSCALDRAEQWQWQNPQDRLKVGGASDRRDAANDAVDGVGRHAVL